MDRRNFLLNGSAMILTGTAAFKKKAESGKGSGLPPFDATLAELQSAMQSGRMTSHSITNHYLERINRIDKKGPALNSVIEINPDALDIAGSLDDERKHGRFRGPLHGIPILLKDNIDTADRMRTTAGSLALVDFPVMSDAFIVRRLREAGAVILGKTNMSEWANFRSTRSTSGWSGRGGLTKNPYAPDRNPSGSSSGSAVAAASGLCAAAVGTETDGSVISPASVNGIVGIKPTVGLVSRSGIIPIAHSQDTAGPLARCVADAAALLGALEGYDPEDPASRKNGGNAGYARFLDPGGLKGMRIGLARNLFGFHDRVDALMENAAAVMKSCGALIIDPADIPNIDSLGGLELEILLYEFKTDLNRYLSKRKAETRTLSLEALIQFNERNAEKEMPYFAQELFIRAQAKGPLTDAKYLKALMTVRRLARQDGIDRIMRKLGLDALVAPTDAPAWKTDLADGDHYMGRTTTPAAVAGYPHITVPMGFVFGLPVGVSFFAGAWSEPKLIGMAYAFEQATKARKRPEL